MGHWVGNWMGSWGHPVVWLVGVLASPLFPDCPPSCWAVPDVDEEPESDGPSANAAVGLSPTKSPVTADMASITTPRPILCVMTFPLLSYCGGIVTACYTIAI